MGLSGYDPEEIVDDMKRFNKLLDDAGSRPTWTPAPSGRIPHKRWRNPPSPSRTSNRTGDRQ
jgi:predicted Zn-dependent protease